MTVRCWQVHDVGEPRDVMRLVTLPRRHVGPAEVRLAVTAAGLSFPDLLQCRGAYQHRPQLPYVPGMELVGTVVEVGADVDGWQVGDRAAAAVPGALATEVVAPATRLMTVDDRLPDEHAVALIGNFTTAWYALVDRGRLAAGETVLVTGAAGGVGSAAVQVARALGARVVAAVGGALKAQACRELGADVVVDLSTADLVEAVRAEVRDGVDVVVDPVGGDVFDAARRVVGWRGRYLVIGFAAGRVPQAPANHVLLKGYDLVGVYLGGEAERDPAVMARLYAEVVDVAVRRGLTPRLHDRPLPMAEAAEALAALGDRQVVGKLVIDPRR